MTDPDRGKHRMPRLARLRAGRRPDDQQWRVYLPSTNGTGLLQLGDAEGLARRMATELGGTIVAPGAPLPERPLALLPTTLTAAEPAPWPPALCRRPLNDYTGRRCMLPVHTTGSCLPVPGARGVAVR